MLIVRYLHQINIELLVIMVMMIMKPQEISHEKNHLGLQNSSSSSIGTATLVGFGLLN